MKKTTGPTKAGVMGRWSIFRGKVNDSDHRVQGFLTKLGRIRVEQAREELARLYEVVMGRTASAVSDADTIEYLALGRRDTTSYLKALKKEERQTEKQK